MAVLVTRPEPGLSETMRAVAGLGYQPVACPMLVIRARRRPLPIPHALQAILLTSRQALGPLAEAADARPALRRLPLFAVGDRTAADARDAGFARSLSAGGDARDLEAMVRKTQPAGDALLFPTGQGQGRALAASLRAAGYRLHVRWAYGAISADGLSAEGLAALGAGIVTDCLFFSGETGRNFVRHCPVGLRWSLGGVRALAISHAVAARIDRLPWKSVEVAPRPGAAAMLSLLRSSA